MPAFTGPNPRIYQDVMLLTIMEAITSHSSEVVVINLIEEARKNLTTEIADAEQALKLLPGFQRLIKAGK